MSFASMALNQQVSHWFKQALETSPVPVLKHLLFLPNLLFFMGVVVYGLLE